MTLRTRTFNVRLEPAEQLRVKAIAAEHETTLVGLFTELAKEYAAGPMPPEPEPVMPQSEMLQTKITLPEDVVAKAKLRATREHVVLSDELYRMALRRVSVDA